MTENELCSHIADCLTGVPLRGRRIRKLLHIIRFYTNALVAAAVNECAEIARIPHGCTCEGGVDQCGATYCHMATAAAIRSIVTPESAAKELERIKNEEYHRGTDVAVCHPARCRDEMVWRKEIVEAQLGGVRIIKQMVDDGFNLLEIERYCDKRFAELETEKMSSNL